MRATEKVDVERIRATVGALVEAHDLPGLAVGVVTGDDLVYAEGFGFADIESRRPQNPALRQRIGSITKTMLGLCTMALVDEGKLSLDDRVVDRLPEVEFQGAAETLAIRHLLTHTGGIGEAPTMDDYLAPHDVLWSDALLTQTTRQAYPRGVCIEATPGTKWAYANHGFALLGRIVAQIEGAPIEEVLHTRIFGPLNMTNTDCHDRPHADLTTGYHRVPSDDELDVMALLGRAATAEEPVDRVNIRGRYRYVRPRAAGAVQSTIVDMARYASALIRKGGGIVQPSTFDEMVSPHWCPDKRLGSVGLTFFRKERFGRQTFGHGGGIIGGWNTHITVVPEAEMAVLAHLNLSFEDFSRVEGGVLQAALGASRRELPTRPTVAKGVVESACGVYEPPPGHLTNFRTARSTGLVEVSERDGELSLRARRGPWRRGVLMAPVAGDDPTLFVLDQGEPEPPLVAFTLSPEGAVEGLRFDRLVEMRKVRPRS